MLVCHLAKSEFLCISAEFHRRNSPPQSVNVHVLLFRRWLKREEREKEQGVTFENSGPKLDLSFKEGQTIKINLGVSVWNRALELI